MPSLRKPNLQRLLAKWQRRLHLQHWDITIAWASYEEIEKCVGRVTYSLQHQTAKVQIATPETIPHDEESNYKNLELSLVHELVHLVIAPVVEMAHRAKGNVGETLKEQVVESLAKSFLEL